MNLGELISQKVAAQLDAAFVEKEVETRVSKLVVEAVSNALRSYGETGKLIEKAVEDALRVSHIDLPSYGHVVTQILQVQIESRVAELVAGRLSQDMEALLSLAPKEIKLSQIAKDMVDEGSHGVEYGEAITVIVERTEYRSVWVYLDEQEHHEDRDKYKCRHSMLLSEDGTISSATVDKRPLRDTSHIGRSYGLDQKLRAYVACGTKIILDEDAVVVTVGDY